MREIKFRAWDKVHKEMFYHDHTDLNCGISDGRDYEYTSTVIVSPYNDCNLIWLQYTGLKDKNGVEIYEGDILKQNNIKVVIEWENESCGFYPFVSECFNAYYKVEIIGNIYENKELLDEHN